MPSHRDRYASRRISDRPSYDEDSYDSSSHESDASSSTSHQRRRRPQRDSTWQRSSSPPQRSYDYAYDEKDEGRRTGGFGRIALAAGALIIVTCGLHMWASRRAKREEAEREAKRRDFERRKKQRRREEDAWARKRSSDRRRNEEIAATGHDRAFAGLIEYPGHQVASRSSSRSSISSLSATERGRMRLIEDKREISKHDRSHSRATAQWR